jgi:hypothetical protein
MGLLRIHLKWSLGPANGHTAYDGFYLLFRAAHAPPGGTAHVRPRGRIACDPAGHAACGMPYQVSFRSSMRPFDTSR